MHLVLYCSYCLQARLEHSVHSCPSACNETCISVQIVNCGRNLWGYGLETLSGRQAGHGHVSVQTFYQPSLASSLIHLMHRHTHCKVRSHLRGMPRFCFKVARVKIKTIPQMVFLTTYILYVWNGFRLLILSNVFFKPNLYNLNHCMLGHQGSRKALKKA